MGTDSQGSWGREARVSEAKLGEAGVGEAGDAGERVPLRWRILLPILRRLPQGLLSRGTGWLAERRVPRVLRQAVIGGFARVVGADLEEAERSPPEYESVSHFFTRRLREGARSWPSDPLLPSSPVDGVVGAMGRLDEGTLIQAKGKVFSARALLGGAGPHADEGARPRGDAFQHGAFLTIYLSPRHYHRIHAPVGGGLLWARAVPGKLLPVNEPAVASVPELFPRNERLVAVIQSSGAPRPSQGGAGMGDDGARTGDGDGTTGAVALVAVGAFNVGRISAAFDPDWNGPDGLGVTNRRRRRQVEERVYDPPVPVRRGEDFMAFHLGSTVVLLFEGEERVFHPEIVKGAEVKVGQPLFQGVADPGAR